MPYVIYFSWTLDEVEIRHVQTSSLPKTENRKRVLDSNGNLIYADHYLFSKNIVSSVNQSEQVTLTEKIEESSVWKQVGLFLKKFSNLIPVSVYKRPNEKIPLCFRGQDLSDVENFYFKGKEVSELHISVSTLPGEAVLSFTERGDYSDDGKTYLSSLYVVPKSNTISLPPSVYPPVEMRCLHKGSNHYKFYRFIPDNSQGYINVCWGRNCKKEEARAEVEAAGEVWSDSLDNLGYIDCPRYIIEPYPTYLFWIRYFEKLGKGYIDVSKATQDSRTSVSAKKPKVVKSAVVTANDTKAVSATASSELYNFFLTDSKKYIKSQSQSRTKDEDVVITLPMYQASRKYLNIMKKTSYVSTFNNNLQKLMLYNSRAVTDVGQSFIPAEFENIHKIKNEAERNLAYQKLNEIRAEILDREESYLNSMYAVLSSEQTTRDSYSTKSPVLDFGSDFDVSYATPADLQLIKSQLAGSNRYAPLDKCILKAYKITPKVQSLKFKKYLKNHHLSQKDVKLLWHGSKTCNWISIIKNSLMLNPNAEITGKMFGDGIYFAPKADKSFGYTSHKQAYWNSSSSTCNPDIGVMGLYSLAYGNPLDCYSSYSYKPSDVYPKGFHCVHAHAGSSLVNDEIIVYDEGALCLEYVVLFKF